MATSELKFCKNCSNMLYYREKDTTEGTDRSIALIEFCKRCGYENESITTGDEEIVIYEKNYEDPYIQPYIDDVAFGDPAVPTTTEIVCPNKSCPSHEDGNIPSAKFIVTNPDSYSILYKCNYATCGQVWRNTN